MADRVGGDTLPGQVEGLQQRGEYPLARRFEPPDEATIRRVLEAVDADTFGAAVGALAGVKNLAWRHIPAGHRQRGRGHGREEHRTLQAATVAAGLAFPHAVQAIRLTRRIRPRQLASREEWACHSSGCAGRARPRPLVIADLREAGSARGARGLG